LHQHTVFLQSIRGIFFLSNTDIVTS
jgi:hypothetical protein